MPPANDTSPSIVGGPLRQKRIRVRYPSVPVKERPSGNGLWAIPAAIEELRKDNVETDWLIQKLRLVQVEQDMEMLNRGAD